MAKPRAIAQPPPYLTRSVFRFTDPTGLSADQWRLIASEPINKMAQRFIIREISALSFIITSEKRDDPRVEEYTRRWENIWEDKYGDGKGWGFSTWLSLMIEDTCTLPFGGACEAGYRGTDLQWCNHVDAATLLPTYERLVPYMQVNPDNFTQRIYFKRGQLRRIRVNPRTDIRYKEYQISPTQDAYVPIEALSKIYIYYMQELTDTPPMGIIDVADWSSKDAEEWAYNFREMVEGVDPIKIPILYDHTGTAQFIPFGRSPNDLNIVEQFKRFAEMLLGKYGLSIGDLRLFEHESTKAGERVSQAVTERSGIGFWAAIISTFITSLLPPGLKFQFKQPRPEKELTVANRKAVQLRMLQEATGGKPILTDEDALEQALAWEIFDVEVEVPDEEVPVVPPTPSNGGPPPGGRPQEEIDEEADQDLVKALVEKIRANPQPPATEAMEEVVYDGFANSARKVNRRQIADIVDLLREQIELTEGELKGEVEKGGPGSGNWGHTGRPGKRGGSGAGGGLGKIGARAGTTAHERRAISQRARGKQPKIAVGQATKEARIRAERAISMKDDDFRVSIHLEKRKFLSELQLSVSKPAIARTATPDGRSGIDITINGKQAPKWASSFAKREILANTPVGEIARKMGLAFDLSTKGKEIKSKFIGRDVLTGETIDIGTAVVWSRQSGAVLPKSLQEIIEE